MKDIKVGDWVRSADLKKCNQVMFVEKVLTTSRDYLGKLYSPVSTLMPFATINHPLIIDGDYFSIDPNQNNNWYPWLGHNKKLNPAFLVSTPEQYVYNLWVDGDGTYIVNNFGTTSIIGDGGLLRWGYENKVLTYGEVLLLMLRYTEAGRNPVYGSYIFNKILPKIKIGFVNKTILNILKKPGIARDFIETIFVATGWVANKLKDFNI